MRLKVVDENFKPPCKVYCKNCVRWYLTKADQCDIPNPGFASNHSDRAAEFEAAIGVTAKNPKNSKPELMKFYQEHSDVHQVCFNNGSLTIFGHPSYLNKNNNCKFYLALPRPFRFLTNVARYFILGNLNDRTFNS